MAYPIVQAHFQTASLGQACPLSKRVHPFVAWSEGHVRKVVWLTGGVDEGDPCQAMGHHGFAGIDAAVVNAVTSFAVSPR